jgi:Saxitoxin biosynthesis operon protein SxtJ
MGGDTVDRGGVELRSYAEGQGPGSNRSFGFVFAGAFAVIGLLPALHHHSIRIWALALAGVFLAVALVIPAILRPLNKAWFLLGMMLGKIVTPVMMGLIFFVGITPLAALRRSLKSSGLDTGFDRKATSYWIPREPAVRSFKQQF